MMYLKSLDKTQLVGVLILVVFINCYVPSNCNYTRIAVRNRRPNFLELWVY